LTIPAYTFSPDEVEIVRERHQRFTMKDIGNIEKRVQNVEYYTSLNLLERSAQDLEVTDAAGLNRFKSGFVVDNYAGHRTGDVANPDYKCSIDPEHNELRPKHKMQNIKLIESATTDAARTAAHYQKTGDVLTLPYEEITLFENLIATRVERVSGFLKGQWKGTLELDPYGDDWFEPEVRPTITVSVAHDFDFAAALPDNVLGSLWNSWQSQWYGVVEINQPGEEFANNKFVRSIESRRPKSKVSTEAIANIERVGDQYRIVTQGTRPFIRAQDITYIAKNLKPNTIHYPFFDGRNVAKFVTPSEILTDSVGSVTGVFSLPDPTIVGNPKFPTGEIEFRLTSSPNNLGRGSNETDPVSVAYAIYYATGRFAQTQAVYISLRPPPPPPVPARVRRSYSGEDYYNNGLDSAEADADHGESADEGGDMGGDDGDGDGDSKVICTALNQMYGFGSFRNVIWMKHNSAPKDSVKYPNSECLELGYHKIFGPLAKKMPDSPLLAKILGRIARVRTDRVRRELKGKPLTLESKIHMLFLRPPAFVIGWLINKGIIKKYDIEKHRGMK
jgi:hypothetical protein